MKVLLQSGVPFFGLVVFGALSHVALATDLDGGLPFADEGQSAFQVENFGPVGMPLPQAPLPLGSHGLVGNSNYLVYSDCQPLKNPGVLITLTSAMNAGPKGFDFQLNANSLASKAFPNGVTPAGKPGRMGWQQYIINVRPGSAPNTTDVWGFIEPWPTNEPGVSNKSDLVNTSHTPFHLVTLSHTPTPTLPAGTTLTIALGTDPRTDSVTTLTFTAKLPPSTPTTPLYGHNYYNGVPIRLIGLPREKSLCGNATHPKADPRFCPNPANGPGVLSENDLAPITSFQLDFAANLINSGAGNISYLASPTTLLSPAPPSVQNAKFPFMPFCSTGAITAESSNVLYSSMSTLAGQSIPQTFNAVPSCEAGTSAYFFDCDYKSFCATRANAERCLSNGWCFAYPWAHVQPSGRKSCQNVTPVYQRDSAGAWLSRVEYPAGSVHP